MPAVRCASVSAALGITTALILVSAFTVVSGFFLSRDRLINVARTALEQGELPHTTRTNEDFFSECAMLEMQYLRHESVFLNAADTQFVQLDGVHPCQSLRMMVASTGMERTRIPPPYHYVHYPYGSRHLEAVMLSFVEFRTARAVYNIISYLSAITLFLAAWRNSRRTTIVLLPIALVILFGFSLHLFGNNLAHAPGFFFGFLGLSALLVKAWFEKLPMRLFFFGMLGVVISYFDILTGAIPVVLSLSIVLNHFYYVAAEQVDAKSYFISAVSQATAIVACFVGAYVALTVLRLGILSVLDFGWHDYFAAFGVRLGNYAPGRTVSFADNVRALWFVRSQLVPGGAQPATWLIFISLTSWIFALTAMPYAYFMDRESSERVSVDVLVLVGATFGIIVWFLCFTRHTYEHALFIVRLISLPVAYGIVAAILVGSFLLSSRYRARWIVAGSFSSLFVAGILLHGVWLIGMPPKLLLARFVESSADKVSCAALGLRPDGKPDRVVEIRYQPATEPPMALFGLRSNTPTYIRVERRDPVGTYETGATLYILGITKSMSGELLNNKDGSFLSSGRTDVHIFLHFCLDGHDTAESVYNVRIEGQPSPISR